MNRCPKPSYLILILYFCQNKRMPASALIFPAMDASRFEYFIEMRLGTLKLIFAFTYYRIYLYTYIFNIGWLLPHITSISRINLCLWKLAFCEAYCFCTCIWVFTRLNSNKREESWNNLDPHEHLMKFILYDQLLFSSSWTRKPRMHSCTYS